MKNGLIVINEYADLEGITYQSTRLKDELHKLGINTVIVTPSSLEYGVFSSNVELLSEIDFVIFLDKDKYLSRIIEQAGIKMFNSAKTIEVCDDKMLTYLALADYDIPMPDTIPSILCYTKDKTVSEKFLKTVELKLGFPMIAKTSYGSLGKGIFLIKTEDELYKTERDLQFVPHLYQKYEGSHIGEDVRIIVIGGKAVAAMRRYNANDFRSNVEIGGIGEKIEVKFSFLALAEKVAKILGLDYCGVDLLIDKNDEPVLCEVNSNAFFTGIEKATGINVAALYAEYIKTKI